MVQNESTIEQINLGFNEKEDRLLLKVGLADKSEVSVWITRRVCKTIWGLLNGIRSSLVPNVPQFKTSAVSIPESKSQVTESFSPETKNQISIKSINLESEYFSARHSHLDTPILAAKCLILSIDKLHPELELQCTNGQSVKITLQNELVRAITNMIQLSTQEAGWDLIMTSDTSEVTVTTTHRTLH